MPQNKVLIIEDDEVFSSILARRLSQHQFICTTVNTGSDALLKSKQLLPDIVLLDLHLADESGLQYIALLRTNLPKSKIILLTGYASIATAVEAIKLGADEYLAKPIDTQLLLNAIAGNPTKSTSHIPTTLSSEQLEWEHINQVLKFNNGNISATARQLSMHRRTLQRKLQKKPNFQVG